MRRFLTVQAWVPLAYWICVLLIRIALNAVGRWQVVGQDKLPPEGALIVVSNHLSNADPAVVSAALKRRRVTFMAKDELFHSWVGVVVRLYGAFPVRRFEADIGALLHAERLLKRGGVLGMFPEGHRSRTGYMGTPHPGTAMVALRTGATVLPCAITGTEQLSQPGAYFKRPRITVVVGDPIAVSHVRRPTEQQVSALTNRIMDEIKAMLPGQYLPPYTGFGDRAPDGPDPAGK